MSGETFEKEFLRSVNRQFGYRVKLRDFPERWMERENGGRTDRQDRQGAVIGSGYKVIQDNSD